MSDFFGSDPTPSVKRKFGLLAFVVNDVNFEAGASYSVPGVLTREGDLREFKGKRLSKAGEKPSAAHVITMLRARDKDQKEYLMWRDCTTTSKDKAWTILQKSLKATFGKDYPSVVKPAASPKSATWIPCAVDEVPTGESFVGTEGNTVEKSGWKIADWFEDEAKMHDAESKHFSRSNGASTPKINAEIIASVQALIKVAKGNDAKLRGFIANDETLSQFDVEELLKTAA